jgi:hypothetical protein
MDMITPTNQAPGDLRGDPESDDLSQSRVMSTNERRLERLRAWRAANREHLREYQHNSRADHPFRVQIHREREYAHRRETRLRLRQRRDGPATSPGDQASRGDEALSTLLSSLSSQELASQRRSSAQLQEASKATERTDLAYQKDRWK